MGKYKGVGLTTIRGVRRLVTPEQSEKALGARRTFHLAVVNEWLKKKELSWVFDELPASIRLEEDCGGLKARNHFLSVYLVSPDIAHYVAANGFGYVHESDGYYAVVNDVLKVLPVRGTLVDLLR